MDENSGKWKRLMKVLGYDAFFIAYLRNYFNLFVLKLP